MTISEKLHKRLQEELGIPCEKPQRIRRGRHGISAGVWAWYAKRLDCTGDLGSEDTMADCVNAAKLSTHKCAWDRMNTIVNAETRL